MEILKQVREAINFLHSDPVFIHKNITTKNILLTNAPLSGKPLKIYLKGIAQSKTGAIPPKYDPKYTALELINEKEYNEKVDIYSFGVVMWELFSEKIPFEGLSDSQCIESKKNNVLLDIESLEKQNFNSEIIALIFECLDDDPEERPEISEINLQIKSLK